MAMKVALTITEGSASCLPTEPNNRREARLRRSGNNVKELERRKLAVLDKTECETK